MHLTLEEWSEEESRGDLRVWRGPHGAVLSLAVTDELLCPDPSNEKALRLWARQLAESAGGGLVDADAVLGEYGVSARLIYKRLEKPAYVFTGMLHVPHPEVPHVWTVVAGECGPTGVREAVVTTELMNDGKLTIQDYEQSWAKDPYDPTYRGVDRSVLRFVSDDECYDERFPEHPLSRVRSLLGTLRVSGQVSQPEQS